MAVCHMTLYVLRLYPGRTAGIAHSQKTHTLTQRDSQLGMLYLHEGTKAGSRQTHTHTNTA